MTKTAQQCARVGRFAAMRLAPHSLVVMCMNKKYVRPSKRAIRYLALCVSSACYGLISLSTYISHGYVTLRFRETDTIISVSVIVIASITAVLSGYMFRLVRKNEHKSNT